MLWTADGRDVPARRVVLSGEGVGVVVDGNSVRFVPGAESSYARVLPHGDGWSFDPGRPSWVTHLNGKRGASGPLFAGDVMKVNDVVVRYVEDEWPGATSPEQESTLLDAGDDDPRWSVYRDWLLERGSLHGERAVQPATLDDTIRWLWPLAPDLHDGLIDAAWRHGFVRALVVRGSSLGVTRLMEAIVSLDALRLLERLEFVGLVPSVMESPEANAAGLLRLIARTGAPPSLKALSFGVVDAWEPLLVQPALDLARKVAPRLPADASALVRLAEHPGSAQLQLVEQTGGESLDGLSADHPFELRSGTSVVFRRLADGAWHALDVAPPVREDAVRLTHGSAGWMVSAPMFREGVHQPRLNGRPLPHFRVRDGDLLELVPGVVMRFAR